ncbi:MAG: glycosyltransferase family 39 protein [Acidobacteriia bacterium]|nr:glycosyltransferase family 39 protein [Terriglobia bacterium]
MATAAKQTTGWGVALGVAGVIFLAYLAQTPWTTLWDRDEAWFAEAAVEMVNSGRYLVPTFNGEIWAAKPVLLYWLMSSSIRAFGATEFAVRVWSPLGVTLAALFTFAIGRKLFSKWVGHAAMIVLAANLLMMVQGSAATADAVLLASVTGSVAIFVTTQLPPTGPPWARVLLLATPLAIGQFAKGPVGLVVPLVAIGSTILAGRNAAEAGARSGDRRRASLEVGEATVLSIAVLAAWFVLADVQSGGKFAREFFGFHVLQRILTPIEGHGGNFFLTLPFYLPVVLIGFAPWTLYLAGSGSALLRAAVGDRMSRALLCGWIGLPVALFTVVMTKLPHYVLPIWPALALLTAATLDAHRSGALPEAATRWLRLGAWFLAPVVALELAALAAVAVFVGAPGFSARAAVLGGLVVALTFVTLRPKWCEQPWRTVTWLGPATLLCQFLAAAWVLPTVEAVKPVPHLAAIIRVRTEATTPVATFEFDEPSLVFYVGRTPITRLQSEKSLAEWARTEAPGVLVTPRTSLDRTLRYLGTLPLEEIASATGINVAKGRWLELVALRRGARPRGGA